MFETPIGFPVLVHAQIGEGLEIFCGLALRVEDAYGGTARYYGKISIARVFGSSGQNENIEILHGIDHYSKRISAVYWTYPDEIYTMFHDFDDWWDSKEKQDTIIELARRLAIPIVIEEDEEVLNQEPPNPSISDLIEIRGYI